MCGADLLFPRPSGDQGSVFSGSYRLCGHTFGHPPANIRFCCSRGSRLSQICSQQGCSLSTALQRRASCLLRVRSSRNGSASSRNYHDDGPLWTCHCQLLGVLPNQRGTNTFRATATVAFKLGGLGLRSAVRTMSRHSGPPGRLPLRDAGKTCLSCQDVGDNIGRS